MQFAELPYRTGKSLHPRGTHTVFHISVPCATQLVLLAVERFRQSRVRLHEFKGYLLPASTTLLSDNDRVEGVVAL